jgi:crotonobetainyl-CoA:carnitine CoA-transferase CaiB-like acyl-CoA transferase
MTDASVDDTALKGLKVLDLSFFAPGRAASLVLADLGADVVCIEMPRGLRPEASRLDDDTSSRWLLYGRNKRSITLNLKTPGGQAVFERLAKSVDVIIESFKPGTAKNLGVDYESARAINPQIIYCSVSGFGQTGPYSQIAGHEPNYQGLSGALGFNHYEDAPPTVLPTLVGDIAGGAMNATIAILSAMLFKARTGKGQYIDVSIQAGILPLLGSLTYAQWLGEHERQISFAAGRRADFRPYETGDGRFVAISPSAPWTWKKFCTAIDREDLSERPGNDPDDRELVAALVATFKTKTQKEWVEINDRTNVCITAVLDGIHEIENDPQMIHRKVIVEAEYEPMGTVKQILTPFLMSETPPVVRWIPRYGEYTNEVLAELGFGTDEISALQSEGVCE